MATALTQQKLPNKGNNGGQALGRTQQQIGVLSLWLREGVIGREKERVSPPFPPPSLSLALPLAYGEELWLYYPSLTQIRALEASRMEVTNWIKRLKTIPPQLWPGCDHIALTFIGVCDKSCTALRGFFKNVMNGKCHCCMSSSGPHWLHDLRFRNIKKGMISIEMIKRYFVRAFFLLLSRTSQWKVMFKKF